jgi:ATP-binding protein involved in chromosome partitioning
MLLVHGISSPGDPSHDRKCTSNYRSIDFVITSTREPDGPPPSVDDVLGLLRAVVDPELGADIVTLGMVPGIDVAPDGVVTVGVKLTIGGCPLRAQIKKDVESRVAVHPGVRDVRIEWGEMTPDERSDVMLKARWNAREQATETQVPTSCRVLAVASGKGGVGKSSVTVNLAAAVAAQGFTVGVLDADIWGFSVPRLLGIDEPLEAQTVEGSEKPKIIPNEISVGRGLTKGTLKVVSTGFMVGEDTALMWRGLMLTKAVEQFLHDVHWGELDYLFIDMPPGTGDVQMGLARMLPRTDLLIVTTPALAAQKVAARAADMARRSFLRVCGVIENMSSFTCDHGEQYALFGEGGGEALARQVGVPLLGQVPLEPAVAAGGDAGAPVALDGRGRAAEVFRDIARRIVDDVAPPANMSGCSARMLGLVEQALAAKDASATQSSES